jgi:hypothetical protein
MEDKPPDFFKSIKIPLKHILKNNNINLPKINDAVLRAHKIVIHTLLFMKLYLLSSDTLPKIDEDFVNSCMKILCVRKTQGRQPGKDIKALKDKLTNFYELNYKPLIPNEELEYKYLNTVLDYLTTDIITMYENNIKLHYIEYIEKFVNITWKKDFIISKIRRIYKTKKERDSKIRRLIKDLRDIKNDLLTGSFKSKPFYHDWIKQVKKDIIPNKKFQKDSIFYDLQCNPQDYLPCMIYIMKYIEKQGLPINNVFPLRTEITPKNIKLDTTTLVNLLFTENKDEYLTKGNLKKFEDKIWKIFFRTERQCFNKPNYKFHHMILTDGVSCSILLLRQDLINKRLPKIIETQEKYIDELKDYSNIKDKKIVGIDVGTSDLLYCVDNDNKECNKFRYSQDSKRKETKSKKYSKLILEFKNEKIEGKTIIEYETELSEFNKKSLNIKKYKLYIKKKTEINKKLFKFYEKYIFRKLKLNGYINRKKNEQKMINKFKKIFGDSKESIVCIGDWEQKQGMSYGKEPIKGKGLRKVFRQNGYKVFLVDEHKTSCKCANCNGGECKNFIIRKNPKPFRDNQILVHGALSCKNCKVIWNRDCNGAINIHKIAKDAILGKSRPSYLCRNSSVVLNDTTQPKFT